MMWGWIIHLLGLDVRERVQSLEQRMAHNEGAIEGAIAAFKKFAEDAKRD